MNSGAIAMRYAFPLHSTLITLIIQRLEKEREEALQRISARVRQHTVEEQAPKRKAEEVNGLLPLHVSFSL